MKINNFQGELTDISAETEALSANSASSFLQANFGTTDTLGIQELIQFVRYKEGFVLH